jgi:hypothetical protein
MGGTAVPFYGVVIGGAVFASGGTGHDLLSSELAMKVRSPMNLIITSLWRFRKA